MTLLSYKVTAVAGGLCLCLGLMVWQIAEHQNRTRSTDDAFVDADIVNIAANGTGTVETLTTADNARIRKGDPLLSLDSGDLDLALQAARAGQDAAIAQLDEIKAQDRGGGSVLDARRKAAEASLRLAGIHVDQANLALTKARITAPINGYVARRAVSVGDSVRPGQPLLAIVSDQNWITANLKETQLKGVRPGDRADVKIDAFPGLRLKAHVESLQQGAGQTFSLLPAENASGNYVKVVQRVPIKIVLDAPPQQALAPGLSAHVTIHVR